MLIKTNQSTTKETLSSLNPWQICLERTLTYFGGILQASLSRRCPWYWVDFRVLSSKGPPLCSGGPLCHLAVKGFDWFARRFVGRVFGSLRSFWFLIRSLIWRHFLANLNFEKYWSAVWLWSLSFQPWPPLASSQCFRFCFGILALTSWSFLIVPLKLLKKFLGPRNVKSFPANFGSLTRAHKAF